MDRDSLIRLIEATPELRSHVDVLMRMARSCVDIELRSGTPLPSASRFGGAPFVPHDFAWPSHPVAEYRFLGQIDFSEIALPSSPLPRSGLLSLFYLHDEEGEVFWQDDGYVLGYFWTDIGSHSLRKNPHGNTIESQGLILTTGVCLPEREELIEPAADFDEDTLDVLLDDIPYLTGRPNQWLLGYPRYNTLAYDPTPGEGWVPLLTIPSIDAFEWCWHDGDTLMIFIEAAKLTAGDFSELRCDAG